MGDVYWARLASSCSSYFKGRSDISTKGLGYVWLGTTDAVV